MRYLVLAAAILLALTVQPARADDSPNKLLDFAHYLFDQGDYSRATLETRRFLFLFPDNPRRDEAGLLLGRSYLYSGNVEDAEKAYKKVMISHDRPESLVQAALGLGRTLERISAAEAEEFYRQAARDESLPPGLQKELSDKALTRLGWLLMENGRWVEASSVFRRVDDPGLKTPLPGLADRALEGENLPWRSPGAAGMMSAVLPGAGQLYVGRPLDAGLAFGLNALFLYGTVEAVQKEAWAAAAVIGLLEIAWYGGNIYNAINGAHIYNREAQNGFLKRLKRDYGWTVGAAPVKGGAAASLTWNF